MVVNVQYVCVCVNAKSTSIVKTDQVKLFAFLFFVIFVHNRGPLGRLVLY